MTTKQPAKKPRQLKRQTRKAKPRKLTMLEASLLELDIKKGNSKRVKNDTPTIYS
jgi:hypothetical protein